MIVQELYDYAKDNSLLDAEIYVRDEYSTFIYSHETEIKNKGRYTDIELS